MPERGLALHGLEALQPTPSSRVTAERVWLEVYMHCIKSAADSAWAHEGAVLHAARAVQAFRGVFEED